MFSKKHYANEKTVQELNDTQRPQYYTQYGAIL